MEEAGTISLDAVCDAHEAAVGAKAMGLARMKRVGLPVPPGFIVSGAAYREHLGRLDVRLQASLESLADAETEKQKELLASIRQIILESPLPESLRSEIETRCRDFSVGTFAVRSSSTAEDLPGHSFAGQYDTFLDVKHPADCGDAVKKCWASLWTDRAFAYRERNRFDHLAADMAVIVQEFIPADAAGVIFTADPLTGKTDRLIIEACAGSGEALVSGRATPDRFALAKSDFGIIFHAASVEPGAPCIDEDVARRLGELAKKAEAAFGSPQDMEWAVRDGNIFFLQSRPVTSLPKPGSREDRQIWTNLNAGEVMPDVVTPVTWSMVPKFVNALFDTFIGGVGLGTGDNPIIGQIAGRVYFNLNTVAGITRLFPGLSEKDITRIFGGEQQRMEELGHIEIPEEDIPDFDFSMLRLMLRLPGFAFKFLKYSTRKGDQFIDELRRKADKFQETSPSSLSEDELAGFFHRVMDYLQGVVHIIAFAGMGMFFFTVLDKVCRKWLPDSEGTYANRLLAGMGGMHSAEAGLDLWRLAARAHASVAVKEVILAGDGWEESRKRILRAPGGEEFLQAWDGFIDEHGHHTRGEIELYNVRWSETPDYILDVVRGYLDQFGKVNPEEEYSMRAKVREELTTKCRQMMHNPIKRIIFTLCLHQAQRGSLIRENLKSVAVRYLAIMRAALLELGVRLANRGILKNRDDIFFLAMDEIDPVRKGETEFDVGHTIALRRTEYKKYQTITPPKVIVGTFDPDNFVPDDVLDTADTLTGVAVSPGVVVGPARVILRASTEEKVLPGEILVAPFTDPGWTPYFMPAAAIVTDMGGILSHGSIVAREYGIPAVVNVGPATKTIKTGQTLRVDGDRGIVTILH